MFRWLPKKRHAIILTPIGLDCRTGRLDFFLCVDGRHILFQIEFQSKLRLRDGIKSFKVTWVGSHISSEKYIFAHLLPTG
jgi:hypothetical protein